MLETDSDSMMEEVKHKQQQKNPRNKLISQTTFQRKQIKMWVTIKYRNCVSN